MDEKNIWPERKKFVLLHRLPKGYGQCDLEPHNPKAIGSRGRYKVRAKGQADTES